MINGLVHHLHHPAYDIWLGKGVVLWHGVGGVQVDLVYLGIPEDRLLLHAVAGPAVALCQWSSCTRVSTSSRSSGFGPHSPGCRFSHFCFIFWHGESQNRNKQKIIWTTCIVFILLFFDLIVTAFNQIAVYCLSHLLSHLHLIIMFWIDICLLHTFFTTAFTPPPNL